MANPSGSEFFGNLTEECIQFPTLLYTFAYYLIVKNQSWIASVTVRNIRQGRSTCRPSVRPPVLVQRCNGTTAGLGYLEVNVICPCKSPGWAVD
jgi:hypothetical protein